MNKPTHVVRYKNNWDGEGDVMYTLAYKADDEFYIFEDEVPVLSYVGDEIIESWEMVLEDKGAQG